MTTLVVSIRRIRRFQHLLRDAYPAGDDTQDWVDELAASLGLLRSPTVWWVGGKLSPLVWSLGWRPRLIIPVELWKGLDDHQRATLIIHELAHLRRGDHHLRFFELIVTALYWWHPVFWWARHGAARRRGAMLRRVGRLGVPDAAKSYAETLLETLDFLNHSEPRRTAVGQRIRQGPSSPKEVNHDHDRNNAPAAGNLGHAGLVGLGGRALARQCHLGAKARGEKRNHDHRQGRR